MIGAHPFPEEVMEKCDHLQIICKHGAGLDNIPLEKAKECGIAVCNVPGTNSNAVADLAIGLMLAVTRNIVIANNRVRNGEWKPGPSVLTYASRHWVSSVSALSQRTWQEEPTALA